MTPPADVTDLLEQLTLNPATQTATVDRLMPMVYDELREMAEQRLRNERAGHTLQPTALVNEAYLRMVDQSRVDWAGQTHFRAIASEMMYRVLCDHARQRDRLKRGGDRQRLTLDLAVQASGADSGHHDAADLTAALERLSERDPRQFEIARLRYMGGMTIDDTAQHLGISTATVEREWAMAKAWLKRELSQGQAS